MQLRILNIIKNKYKFLNYPFIKFFILVLVSCLVYFFDVIVYNKILLITTFFTIFLAFITICIQNNNTNKFVEILQHFFLGGSLYTTTIANGINLLVPPFAKYDIDKFSVNHSERHIKRTFWVRYSLVAIVLLISLLLLENQLVSLNNVTYNINNALLSLVSYFMYLCFKYNLNSFYDSNENEAMSEQDVNYAKSYNTQQQIKQKSNQNIDDPLRDLISNNKKNSKR